MRKSIVIGKKGENKVAEMLREWWGDEHFIRNYIGSSGAVATMQANNQHIPKYVLKALCGDIMTPIDFPWCVEVKNYKTLNIAKEITKKNFGKIGKFWQQCYTDAQRASRHGLLIVFSDLDYPMVITQGKFDDERHTIKITMKDPSGLGAFTQRLTFMPWDEWSKLQKTPKITT